MVERLGAYISKKGRSGIVGEFKLLCVHAGSNTKWRLFIDGYKRTGKADGEVTHASCGKFFVGIL